MPKRILQGTVVSDKNDKTVVVRVERRFTHPLIKKTVRRSKKYQAHDENNQFKVGDSGADRGMRADFENDKWLGGRHRPAWRPEPLNRSDMRLVKPQGASWTGPRR
jgi:small subunit ribosomal protein S17